MSAYERTVRAVCTEAQAWAEYLAGRIRLATLLSVLARA